MNEGKKDRRDPIRTIKARNPVAKNATAAIGGGAAGAHKDKKKAMKQGEVKHKKAEYAESLQAKLDSVLAEGPNDGKEDNFTIDDIKRLEKIRDLETLKAQAKELIKGKPARRMKPEKISWFYNHIDTLKNPLAVIKMMYDLMLAGEGHRVIGSRNSMSSNNYRSRFGEEVAEKFNAEYDDESGMADNNLETLKRAVDGIDNVIQTGDNLPEWCQEKIAVAKSMLVTVWDYMLSEKNSEQGVAEASALEKFRKASAEREKKHNDAEKEMNARHARGEEDMKGAIDRLEKHVNTKEGWTHDSLAAQLFETENTYEDRLTNLLNKRLGK